MKHVWGSVLCTSTIDKLGEKGYNMAQNLYQYKGVHIPPLGMVDDIISVTNVEKSLDMKNCINTFIESKKLTLSHKKCFNIHIGKGYKNLISLCMKK